MTINRVTSKDLIQLRLANQQIASQTFSEPHQLVSWFGGIQGQDYKAAKWAIALRLKSATDADIEQAIENKKIVRTWPMRLTLHFVAAEDIWWLLSLTSPRNIKNTAPRFKELGLTAKKLNKSNSVIVKALEGGNQLTRPELTKVLRKAGLTLAGNMLSYLLAWAGMQKLVCFGVKKGNQVTYTLLDEWVPNEKKMEHEDALAELAKRYFTSRGPATLQDFIWWSGFSITEAKTALDLARNSLISIMVNNSEYWAGKNSVDLRKVNSKKAFLLPWFDEYLIAYKNRSLVLDEEYVKKINAGGGMLNPSVVVDDRIAGTWKRELKKDKVIITIAPFSKFSETEKKAIVHAAEAYANFLGLTAEVN